MPGSATGPFATWPARSRPWSSIRARADSSPMPPACFAFAASGRPHAAWSKWLPTTSDNAGWLARWPRSTSTRETWLDVSSNGRWGETSVNRGSETPSGGRVLAILGFHKIGGPPAGGRDTWFYVSEATFSSFLSRLQEDDWRVIDLPTFLM